MSALKHVVDSLIEVMFDAGVTVQDFNYLLRERAVRAATKRVVKNSGRNSKSRVAIITGLARSEVSRISASSDSDKKTKSGHHPARRVLATWFDNPRFLTKAGEPAILQIYGKRRSFENLVLMEGGGIPVRAMLDELVQIDAVERLANQHVRAKSRVPISVGLTPNAIAAVGERCSDLLQTLTKNLRRSVPTQFEATSQISDADPTMLPLIRREIADQGASFINGASSLLKRSQHKSERALNSVKCRVGVTVYYFEDGADCTVGVNTKVKQGRRTNLRRQRYPIKK